ncbi:MAG: copper amine oxidase [Defluviitaleaceae bacterium]|jgi:uncharacterized protein YkwD|nr:copper amine oxidase [Defluviitaleaceae bacterium]
MKRFKDFILGFSIAAILFSVSNVNAADVLKNIQVFFKDMPVYVEGIRAELTQKPMLYNGTTYLPMRTVAQILGKNVLYDEKTGSIYIYSEGNEPVINMNQQKESNKVNDAEFVLYNIKIGDNKEHVINELGNPDRQDASEYGFTWFIYNKDYKNYIQVGIKDGKVVGLYTNSASWQSKKGIKFGSTGAAVKKAYGEPLTYIQKGNVRYMLNTDTKEANTFLINDAYVTLFYDLHQNQTVTSILIIEKKTEHSLNSFYGKASNELVKAYEMQIFDLANSVRVRNGLKPFVWDDQAAKSSLLHSEDMSKNNFFSHTNLKGQSPFDRMVAQGIKYSLAGENIAAGQTNAIYAHEGWMNSEGHRKNILGDFERLGVGVCFGGEYKIYYTQNFYTPR